MATAVAAPAARASARYVRSSASKVRPVLDLIRGESCGRADEILQFSERRIAGVVARCLDSAIANAEHNSNLPVEELYVAACYADEGPTLKRGRPQAPPDPHRTGCRSESTASRRRGPVAQPPASSRR